MKHDLANPPTDYTDVAANVAWRQWATNLVETDDGALAEVVAHCEKSCTYYINGFVWTYLAKPTGRFVPMILWPIQTRLIELLERIVGYESLHLDKSRDMGATWCLIDFADWYCRFHDNSEALIVSWKAKIVDKRGNKGTLFGKLDIINDHLPIPMRCPWNGKKYRQNLYAAYPKRGSLLKGESTTDEAGRADRVVFAMLDEFAHVGKGKTVAQGYAMLDSLSGATDSVFMLSTPAGMGGAFADNKHQLENHTSMWWPDHPIFSDEMQTVGATGGQVETLRPDSGFFSDNHEALREKITSPWLEGKQKKFSAQTVAQEIQIDYAGAGHQWFPQDLIQRITVEDCEPPFHVGSLIYSTDSGACRGFLKDAPDSRLSLWINLVDGWPTRGTDYGIGIDVAQGSKNVKGEAASNSCAVVVDLQTATVVAELCVAGIEAPHFMVMCVALGNFFHKAYMIWEANGPGLCFVDVPTVLCYPWVYHRRNLKSVDEKESNEPGFWSMPHTKSQAFISYRVALQERHFTERSLLAVRELKMFQERPGEVVHAYAVNTNDPTGAKFNHGDRQTARVMIWHGMTVGLKYNPLDTSLTPVRLQREPPRGSIAWIQKHSVQEPSDPRLVY